MTQQVNEVLEATLLTKCPECGGEADNGHDRCLPPNVYTCTKCMKPTHKERAEAYVREKCPELMELRFGCRVNQTDEDGYQRKNMVVVGNSFTKPALYIECAYTYGTTLEGERETYSNCHFLRSTIEVIGQPIQLQHWLRVLKKKGMEVDVSAHFAYVMYGLDCTISFSLATGQPATEADYQAFNQIVYGN